MESEPFDRLTRGLSASTSRRQMFRMLARAAAGGLAAWAGGSALAPNSARAANCQAVGGDGECPPNTNKRGKAGNQPTVNGCGAEGSDFRPPQGFGEADYTPACNNHDVCYEMCDISKGSCDFDFLLDMRQSCRATYSWNLLYRAWCSDLALIFTAAVGLGGGDAWRAAQQKACECCSTVYCSCNQSCYDDVNVCLDECKTSLGCFTGICGPASAEQCP